MALDPKLAAAFKKFAIHIQDLMINPEYAEQILGSVFDAYAETTGDTWKREGTTLSPKNDGDDVDVGLGGLKGGGAAGGVGTPMKFISGASGGELATGVLTLLDELQAGDEFTVTISGTPYTVVADTDFDIVAGSKARYDMGIGAGNLIAGDYIEIVIPTVGTYTLVAGTDFAIGGTWVDTTWNLVNAINGTAVLQDYIEAIVPD